MRGQDEVGKVGITYPTNLKAITPKSQQPLHLIPNFHSSKLHPNLAYPLI